jgi:hypothetical protein
MSTEHINEIPKTAYIDVLYPDSDVPAMHVAREALATHPEQPQGFTCIDVTYSSVTASQIRAGGCANHAVIKGSSIAL